MPTAALPGTSSDLDAVFRTYRPMVRRALRRLGVSEAVVDDAVQDVFVVLVRRIDTFDRDRSLANWLWGIARGVASTHRRSRQRRQRLLSVLPRGADAGRPAPEELVAAAEARAILDDFLGTLDDDKCAVFVMAEVEGRTGPEIAASLDVNINTVYARLRAARRRFDTAVARHRPARSRGLVAAWWPGALWSASAPTWIPATASSALAAALVLPIALPSGPQMPSLSWTAEVPEKVDEAAPARPSAETRRPSMRAALDREEILIIEEEDDAQVDNEPAKEDGETVAASAAAQESTTMRIPVATALVAASLISTTALAKPKKAGDTWRVDDPQSADEAALRSETDVDRRYEFDNDFVDGENLSPDGTILLQPPNIRFESLITIRGHFNAELVKLGSDV